MVWPIIFPGTQILLFSLNHVLNPKNASVQPLQILLHRMRRLLAMSSPGGCLLFNINTWQICQARKWKEMVLCYKLADISVDDVEDDVQMSPNYVDYPKPKKLTRRQSERLGGFNQVHENLATPSETRSQTRIAVSSSVETSGLCVTQSEASLPGVETVTGVRGLTILHSLPVSVDLDPGRRLGPRPVHTQCPHCRAFIITRTEATFGLFACLSSGLCCLSGWVKYKDVVEI